MDQVIREIIRRIKELDFGAILDDIGALKMPFLGPYWPEVRSFPRCGCVPRGVERHGIGTVAAKVGVVGAARDLAGVPVCRRVPSAASRLAL